MRHEPDARRIASTGTALGSARRTGRAPRRVHRYDTVGGMYSVTSDWFFYDDNDELVDVHTTHFSD